MRNPNAKISASNRDEVERIDREWEQDRRHYLLRLKTGLQEPTVAFAKVQRIGSRVLAAAAVLGSIAMMAASSEPTLAPLVIGVAGIFLGWLGQWESERTTEKAAAYDEAYEAYCTRRARAAGQYRS